MLESDPLFKGDVSSVSDTDIDGPIAGAKYPYCEWYWAQFDAAAKAAKASGNAAAYSVYAYLVQLLLHRPNFDDASIPYGYSLSNLSNHDLSALCALANKTMDPALRARLFDLVWVQQAGKRDHKAASEAATAYFSAANRAESAKDPNFGQDAAATYYRRGLQLALLLGREKDLFKNGIRAVQEACRNSVKNEEGPWRYLDLLSEFKTDTPLEFAEISAELARKGKANRRFYDILKYWQSAAEFYSLAKEPEKARDSKLEAAEAYVIYAEDFANAEPPNYPAAAGNLLHGIEVFRRLEQPHRVKDLRTKLADYQKKSTGYFSSVKIPFDASEIVAEAQEKVRRPDLREAVFNLVFGYPLTSPDQIRKRVVENAKKGFFRKFFSSSYHDDQGRLVAQHGPMRPDKNESLDEATVTSEMFSWAARTDWQLRALAYVEPARNQILEDHFPSLQDLSFIVRDNPFVPSGHEGIFLRGLHAGFHGDFLVASHLLVPQIENSVRHYFQVNGILTTTLHPNGLEDVKLWGDNGGLLGMPEFEALFGKELKFELRGHLVEKTAFNFRNRLSHGMVSENECYSIQGISTWWLALRLCFPPYVSPNQ